MGRVGLFIRNISFFFVFIVFVLCTCASSKSQLSPAAQRLMGMLNQFKSENSLDLNPVLLNHYPIQNEKTRPAINVILNITSKFDIMLLTKLDIMYKKLDKNKLLLQCPLDQFKQVTELKDIIYVDVDSKIHSMAPS